MTPGAILVVGDAMWDVVVRAAGPVLRGRDQAARIRTLHGGSAANQAVWLAHFGAPVRLAARVGREDLGRWTLALAARGVEPRLVPDPEAPTGTLVALVDPDGERSFLTDRGAAARLSAADLHHDLLEGVSRVHLSGYALVDEGPRAAVLELLRRATDRGLPISLDPGSAAFIEETGRPAILPWTAAATLCFPNADEARALAGTPDRAEQRRRLAAHYGTVVIKRGAEGAELADDQGALHISRPASADAIDDTTGAGDAFAAAYLAALMRGTEPERCLEAAVAAGTAACRHLGAWPS